MTTQVPAVIQTSARDLGQLARRYLAGWRGVIVLAVVAIAGGVALGWSWLVAAGIAPLLISLLPCAAMCALGLCMNRRGGRSCSIEDTSSRTATVVETVPPSRVVTDQQDRLPAGAAISSAVEADLQANIPEQRSITHAQTS